MSSSSNEEDYLVNKYYQDGDAFEEEYLEEEKAAKEARNRRLDARWEALSVDENDIASIPWSLPEIVVNHSKARFIVSVLITIFPIFYWPEWLQRVPVVSWLVVMFALLVWGIRGAFRDEARTKEVREEAVRLWKSRKPLK